MFNVGDEGILTGDSSVLAHNTVSNVSVSSGDHPAVQGGKQTAGNFCDDGTCGDTRRRYYLTQDEFIGNQPLTACADGFHMAAIWEIRELSNLRYDATLGFGGLDLGSGPPSEQSGWVRTGRSFASGSTLPGTGNCELWTNGTKASHGSTMFLSGTWDVGGEDLGSPWSTGVAACDEIGVRVWCVEN